MTTDPLLLKLGDCHDLRLAGGKAARLARLIEAGFPVPDGFVVTAAAYRQARDRGDSSVAADLAGEIAAWYGQFGSPAVAVRSSATAEDLADASMAGQYQTFLNVQGAAAVLEAIQQCWSSVDSDRTRAYLAEHGLDPADVAMAVVVQQLVPADVAGVLFTANPRNGSRDQMLIEANWGLGETVVSGTVQPDSLLLDRTTGQVTAATIAEKKLWLPPGSVPSPADADGSRSPSPSATCPVPEDKQAVPCLTAQQVHELWWLGVHVAEHFGSPQDLEWAIHQDQLYLLQSRPITTLADAEAYARCLDQTRSQLRQAQRDGRGDWVRHNLAETLPHPTPLTWSVMQRFMSGAGGFGAMYRMVGFEPSEAVQEAGFLELIAGQIYTDLARAPGMFFANFPYRYDLDRLRTDPDAAQGPPTIPAGSFLQQYRVGRRLAGIHRQLAALARDYDRRLDEQIIPAFVQYVQTEQQRSLRQLSTAQWLALWRERERQVLDEFAPQSLLPSLIAAMALDKLRGLLAEHFWDEDPGELSSLLSSAGAPDQTLAASQGLYDLACGRRTLPDWLESFGHRAPEEFDLASPRWRERPEAMAALAERLRDCVAPLDLHEKRAAEAAAQLESLGRRLRPAHRRELNEQVRLVHRYLRFREDGKHYLMLGYQLLRDLALEAGRRLGLGEDVFLLTWEELQLALTMGFAPLHLVDERRVVRTAEAKLILESVITAADIDLLGQPPPPRADGDCLAAFPISAGLCSGPARIVRTLSAAGELGRGYVLVCPSTDPSWTPLFVGAAGLVLECGGTLSHGAVVARELGLPAVVCAGATHLLQEGETIQVDGHRGAVVRVGNAAGASETVTGMRVACLTTDPNDTRIPRELVPPVAGRRERHSARLRNVMLLVWGAYLAAAFLLPEAWLYESSVRVLDRLLWPIVAGWGKPAAVALTAAALAVITIVGQWLLTDTCRLRVAKKRASRLRKEAGQWPAGSPRQQSLLALARPVQTRVVMAAMVPLAVILGPLVMSFLWFPLRVDPASWNARPGATVYVVATVDGECTQPISLAHDPVLTLDESTPASQTLPPIRATLTDRLTKWRKTSDLSDLPWEVQEAGRWISRNLLADLSDYLSRDLPPQTLAWTLYTPGDQPGRFPVTLSAERATPIQVQLVLGDTFPPERKEDLGDGKGPVQVVRPADRGAPIKLVKLTYFEPKKPGRPIFWAPLARLGWTAWDAGWLLTYLLAYLPVMIVVRWLLRLP